MCAIEAVYAECLRECGINTPDTEYFDLPNGQAAFASKRFDRHQDMRVPMQSLAAFIGADFRSPGTLDYVGFLRATGLCTNDVREKALAFERAHGLTHVVVDEPQGFENSIPTVWAVTSPKLAILRLHGRNAATWNIGGEAASDRFNYDYSDAELGELVAPLRKTASQVGETHAIFNNNYGDQGQRNAATLQSLLQQ